MSSLIRPDQLMAVTAVLLALSALGFWAETRDWGRKLSGALIIIVLAMVLAVRWRCH